MSTENTHEHVPDTTALLAAFRGHATQPPEKPATVTERHIQLAQCVILAGLQNDHYVKAAQLIADAERAACRRALQLNASNYDPDDIRAKYHAEREAFTAMKARAEAAEARFAHTCEELTQTARNLDLLHNEMMLKVTERSKELSTERETHARTKAELELEQRAGRACCDTKDEKCAEVIHLAIANGKLREQVRALMSVLVAIESDAHPIRDPLNVVGGSVRAADIRLESIRAIAHAALAASASVPDANATLTPEEVAAVEGFVAEAKAHADTLRLDAMIKHSWTVHRGTRLGDYILVSPQEGPISEWYETGRDAIDHGLRVLERATQEGGK